MSNLFVSQKGYKPFKYVWAITYFKESEKMHWSEDEVSLADDVSDWENHLSDSEKHLLTNIFRFFTQADIDVSAGYADVYLSQIKNREVRQMLTSFLNRESVHISAYSRLIDELGLPDSEYEAFMQYEEMVEKHNYFFEPREGVQGLAESIAVFSAFGEGLQLFGSFIILFHFTRPNSIRKGRMNGMGQIVEWSIRDESLHVEGMMRIFHTIIDEVDGIDIEALKVRLYEICHKMVALEDAFIDLCFNQANIEGITAEEVKQYIRYLADQRLGQLGLDALFDASNPLPWADTIIFGQQSTNFFDAKPTNYTKGLLKQG
jgi:ribonucleoside-diphosphate reductase beta chain